MVATNPVKIFGENDRLYFLHIQKTAGTSFAALLKRQFTREEICPAYYYPELLALSPEQRQAYRYYRGHFGYGLLNYVHPPLHVITMLRDPIERTISNLDHIRRYPNHVAHQDFNRLSVEDFIEGGYARWEMWNLQTSALGMSPNLSDPTGFAECDSATLQLALERLHELSFVGLVEKYSESVALLNYRFQWRPVKTTEKLNSSPNRMRFENLSARAQALIVDHNCYDLELYAAAKKLFDERFQPVLEEIYSLYYMRIFALQLPRVSQIAIDMSQPIFGDGWEEHSNTFSSRWTISPKATLELNLERGKPLVLRFRIIDILDEALLSSLKVFVNDHFLILKSMNHPSGGLSLSGVITPYMLESAYAFTVISFIVDHTVNVSESLPNSTDKRALGINIAEVSITPFRGLHLASRVLWRYRMFKRRFRWLKDTAIYRFVTRRSQPGEE